jgi:hypothetical protein
MGRHWGFCHHLAEAGFAPYASLGDACRTLEIRVFHKELSQSPMKYRANNRNLPDGVSPHGYEKSGSLVCHR